MSIVNEALKKAAKAKDKKAKEKFSRQEPWVLTITTLQWKKPLLYGGVAVVVLAVGLVGWWALQKAPPSQQGLALLEGKIRVPIPSSASLSESTNLQSQSSKIFDHHQKGLAYYHEKRFKEAEEEFLAILTLDPNHAVAHNNLGLIYYAQGKGQEAALEYLSALRIDPNFAEAMNNLGLLYDQQGRAEEAMSLYDRAVKIKPDYIEAHLNYAIILERLGYLEEAKRHYQRFLSQAPSDLGDVVMSVQARLPNLP
ncbi:MAG: tetratricopeptide repeat protein [Nitrospira sp.]|nr:tetratricopeptide repeat protein [Nitrospira sp.]